MRAALADQKLIAMLLDRLERISVDSIWAHRASGIRGSLLRVQDQLQEGKEPDSSFLREVVSASFHILHQAAREKG